MITGNKSIKKSSRIPGMRYQLPAAAIRKNSPLVLIIPRVLKTRNPRVLLLDILLPQINRAYGEVPAFAVTPPILQPGISGEKMTLTNDAE